MSIRIKLAHVLLVHYCGMVREENAILGEIPEIWKSRLEIRKIWKKPSR